MTREQYLEDRKNNRISIETAYEYYLEHNRSLEIRLPMDIFSQTFQHYNAAGGFDPVTVFEYFDKKFHIMRVMDLKTNALLFLK